MQPFFREILTLIDLPEDIKEEVKHQVTTSSNGCEKTLTKALLPLFEGLEWDWPFDRQAFEERYKTPKQKLDRLVSWVLMEGYRSQRIATMLQNAENRPYWMLTGQDSHTPEPCKSERGEKVIHFNDEFWQEAPVFCEKERCRCRIRALSKSQYLRCSQ